MDWIKTSEQLPSVGASGESEYVLAYRGLGFIPQIVQYSDGSYSRQGWWTQDFRYITFYTGRGDKRRMTFTHWCKIELPLDNHGTIEELLNE